jgi:hypothetical protein
VVPAFTVAAECEVVLTEVSRLLMQRDALRAEIRELQAEAESANRFIAVLRSCIEGAKESAASAQAGRAQVMGIAATEAGLIEIKPGVFLRASAVHKIDYAQGGACGPIVTCGQGETIAIDQAIYPTLPAFLAALSAVARRSDNH